MRFLKIGASGRESNASSLKLVRLM